MLAGHACITCSSKLISSIASRVALAANGASCHILSPQAHRYASLVWVLLLQGTGRAGPPMYRSVRSFIADARHNWLLAVPAGLYAINNYLKFAMQLYFRCGLICFTASDSMDGNTGPCTDVSCRNSLQDSPTIGGFVQAVLCRKWWFWTASLCWAANVLCKHSAASCKCLLLLTVLSVSACLQAHHHQDAEQPEDLHHRHPDAHCDAPALQHHPV